MLILNRSHARYSNPRRQRCSIRFPNRTLPVAPPFARVSWGGRVILLKDAHDATDGHLHKITVIYRKYSAETAKGAQLAHRAPAVDEQGRLIHRLRRFSQIQRRRRQASAKIRGNPENPWITSFPSIARRARRHPPSTIFHPRCFFPSSIFPPEFQTVNPNFQNPFHCRG